MTLQRNPRRSLVALTLGVCLSPGGSAMFARPDDSPQARGATASDIVVTIPPDVLARAGIETATATRGRSTEGLRIPATVQPDAYRQVTVPATSGGRVLAVFAELGQRIAKGDRLVQIHSPEVAEAERAYVGVQADLTLAHQQIARLERLVAIGAASQQELDAVRAGQTGRAADLESARAKLILLGRTAAEVSSLNGPEAINPTVTLLAPLAGTVTARAANVGQTVETSAPLFTIVDLSTVWIVGDAYERDLATIRVGSLVTVSGVALAGETLAGQVAYIDPQIDPGSRTARVRVEVRNPGGRLRLGMLMEMRVRAGGGEAIIIPRGAVQTIGGVSVVYVTSPQRPGTFVERSVRLGSASGDSVEVVAGLAGGESVVTAGSFLVRSERDRANLSAPRPAPGAAPAASADQAATSSAAEAPKTVDIAVTDKGFTPAEISVPANTRIRLRFTRRVEQTCATDVVFPALKIEKPLPLGVPVIIDVPPQAAGRLAFACGMNMYKGQLIIK
jgi:RND family efflux transporter MFP subunit